MNKKEFIEVEVNVLKYKVANVLTESETYGTSGEYSNPDEWWSN